MKASRRDLPARDSSGSGGSGDASRSDGVHHPRRHRDGRASGAGSCAGPGRWHAAFSVAPCRLPTRRPACSAARCRRARGASRGGRSHPEGRRGSSRPRRREGRSACSWIDPGRHRPSAAGGDSPAPHSLVRGPFRPCREPGSWPRRFPRTRASGSRALGTSRGPRSLQSRMYLVDGNFAQGEAMLNGSVGSRERLAGGDHPRGRGEPRASTPRSCGTTIDRLRPPSWTGRAKEMRSVSSRRRRPRSPSASDPVSDRGRSRRARTG